MVDLSVRIGDLTLRNPITLASGTCGFGRELATYVDFAKIGGICSKGLRFFPAREILDAEYRENRRLRGWNSFDI